MRILPVALYFSRSPTGEMLERVHEVSMITHAHPRSLIACGIYSLVAVNLLRGMGKLQAYREAVAVARKYYSGKWMDELRHYGRILDGEICSLAEERVESTGYVVYITVSRQYLNTG